MMVQANRGPGDLRYRATLTRNEYGPARHRHGEQIIASLRKHDGLD